MVQNQHDHGLLEGVNSLVQTAKRKARVYRTAENFIAIIYRTVNNINLGHDDGILLLSKKE